MSCCIRCLVSGLVQGVWYRGFTQERALDLGLDGYAHNLPDGRVEVVACGEAAALEQLQRRLAEGPPAAQVAAVECQTITERPPAGFTTG